MAGLQINLTQVLVTATFITGAIFLPRSRNNRIVLAILFVCLVNELLSYVFLLRQIRNGLLFTVNCTLHNILWLLLMHQFTGRKIRGVILFYAAFAIANALFLEGLSEFNYNTFIMGAFLYVSLYIVGNFSRLQKEDFDYFQSSQFLLLSAPVLLFFGLSFIFGFKSKVLSATVIFGNMNLYSLIGIFINLAYYMILNLYILKEKNTYAK